MPIFGAQVASDAQHIYRLLASLLTIMEPIAGQGFVS